MFESMLTPSLQWHLGNSKPCYHPLSRGFHHFFGVLGGGQNYFTKQCGDGRFDFWRDHEPYWDNVTHTTDLLNREAVRVVESHLSQPQPGLQTQHYFTDAILDALEFPTR